MGAAPHGCQHPVPCPSLGDPHPPGQCGSVGGVPMGRCERQGQEPRDTIPTSRDRATWIPVLSPACGWEGGPGTPLPSPPAPMPAAALAAWPMQQEAAEIAPPPRDTLPVPNNCRAKYSPAGGRCPSKRTPAQSRLLPGGPCHRDPLPGCCGGVGASGHLRPSPGTLLWGIGVSPARLGGPREG